MTAAAPFHPSCTTSCADCGVGTITLGEFYMVKDEVWEQAWCGRRKSWHGMPGQEILCIGCLEHRIGHTLMASDFTDAPVNNPDQSNMSARLRNRITAKEGTTRDILGWMAWGMIKNLPAPQRERAWRAWLDRKHTP
jgi:hypothetical protein